MEWTVIYASYISVYRFRNLWDMNQQTKHCEYDIFIKANDVSQTSFLYYILFFILYFQIKDKNILLNFIIFILIWQS